jgi:6-pyruvoyltetrahydropterin/6-carboxytetrahydropterin synthase
MVIDFAELKEIVKPEIIDKYDHSLVLNAHSPHALIDLSAFEKVFYLPYQPTSENLVMDFATIIQSKMPKRITLCKVVLSETASSFAEWNLEDNQ